MSIESGAGLLSPDPGTDAKWGGEVVRGLLSAAGVAIAAYVAGQRHAVGPSFARPNWLADLERRLTELEDTVTADDPDLQSPAPIPLDRLDKRYTAVHYEALASQVAHERKLAELERRLGQMEPRRHAARAVRCANRSGTRTGGRHHG